jgi:hypothetical protein
MARKSLAVGAILEERGDIHSGRRAISTFFRVGYPMSTKIFRRAQKMWFSAARPCFQERR